MPAHSKSKTKKTSSACGGVRTYYGPVEKELQRVNTRIRQLVSSGDPSAARMLEYVFSGSGKMIRPALLLLSAKAAGGEKVSSRHIEFATIVELVHIATLLHDDIIDEADVRRGIASVNRRWGNDSAVLLGDFLLSKAFTLCAKINLPQVTEMLSETAQRICIGELNQNTQRGRWDMTEQEYLDIIRAKTATLFETSCRLGGLQSGADYSRLTALGRYGNSFGMAFQIIDDMLDITGDQDITGKTLGTDFAKGKPTLPLIYLLADTTPGRRANFLNTLIKDCGVETQTGDVQTNIRIRLAGMLEESGAAESVRQTVQGFCRRAINALESLRDCPAKEALAGLAEFMSGVSLKNS